MLKTLKNWIKIHTISSLLHAFAYMPAFILNGLAYVLSHILNINIKILNNKRRRIIDTNLALCFQNLSAAERLNIRRQNIEHIIRSILERAYWWFRSGSFIIKKIDLINADYLKSQCQLGRPVILLGMHQVGLEAGVYRICADQNLNLGKQFANIYMPGKNPVFDAWLHKTRERFNGQALSKKMSAKYLIKHLNTNFNNNNNNNNENNNNFEKGILNMNADMDFGEKGSIFIPFFGVEAATITNVPRLCFASNAIVIPFYTIYNTKTKRYQTIIENRLNLNCEGLQNKSLGLSELEIQEDLIKINQWYEKVIRLDISQYWWVHRRFKTQRNNSKNNSNIYF